VEAKVRVEGGLPVDFLGLWCHGAIEVVVGGEFGYMVVVVEVDWRWIDLLLTKDVNGVLQLCKPCSLSIYVLPPGFGALNCCVPPHDRFVFLTEPLNLLLDSEQLFLFYNFVFGGFFLPILHLDLFELDISLDDLFWRRCLQGQLMWGTFGLN
jgi:hypothetical protein